MYYKKYFMVFYILISFWCFGIISPAIFHDVKAFLIAKPFLNQMYSTVCHQAHEKTMSFYGENLFVCSRCTGIYLGIFIIGLLSFTIKKKIKNSFPFFLVSSLILLSDVSFTTFGVYHYSKLIALLTGLLLGSTVLLFVLDQFGYFKTQSNYEK
jgi:uncharacterized membrane protein